MSAPATPLPRTDLPDFDRFEARLYAVAGKSRRTAQTYATHARLYTDWLTANRAELALLDADRDVIEDYLIDLASRNVAQASRRLAVYALRAFYEHLNRDRPTAVNPAVQVTPPAQPRPTTTDYSSAELDRLLAIPRQRAAEAEQQGDEPRWIRARFDHAVLATFRYTGIRLAELLGLRLDDVDLARRQLQVHGKGSKQRYIPIPQPLATILTDYLSEIRAHCPDTDRLFANPNGMPGTAVYGQLAERAAFDIVHRHATTAGLTGHHHPHRLRHSYATDLLRRGASLEEIRRLLGHSAITTTIRYLHLTDRDLATAIDRAFHTDSPAVDAGRPDNKPAAA